MDHAVRTTVRTKPLENRDSAGFLWSKSVRSIIGKAQVRGSKAAEWSTPVDHGQGGS